uniref:Uncharacterized protein n=1 Tax=Anopheles dirus TaxID=7168 RepID=A0A182NWQ5_9DIPT
MDPACFSASLYHHLNRTSCRIIVHQHTQTHTQGLQLFPWNALMIHLLRAGVPGGVSQSAGESREFPSSCFRGSV